MSPIIAVVITFEFNPVKSWRSADGGTWTVEDAQSGGPARLGGSVGVSVNHYYD